ncbi:glycoside hydrolase family 127 protein [Kribbella qitaiheensis]|uniref:Glycoside hydrolase family 127 protein n=1 Tax=Kribbella qitaiheensis TaxID=1544730 RepID=A0A7G6XAL9_9ACTN|nr:glycoside hydrolase family 127 protein [Kribbella qitaiheensis]
MQAAPTRTHTHTPGPAAPRKHPQLAPLPLSAVQLDPASLLGGRQELNAAATIPHCVDNIERTGVIANFRRLAEAGAKADADQAKGAFQGPWFADSDLYKTLEAIGWEVGRSGTGQWAELLSDLATLLEQVQAADGYLNTYVQGLPDEEPFSHPEYTHELYCAGHLMQAAVALHRGGGDERFLAIARRVADLVVRSFGDDGRPIIDGHPEVETALIELYRETGEESYLHAAELQVERRGHRTLAAGRFGSQYYQDHEPVREATEAIGHSVRQLYLAAGVTDLYLENGDQTLLEAMEQLWDSAFGTKLYLTGGHGSRHRDEAYGDPYELPPDRAYAETCASIAALQWCWRMLLATGQARYAEEMERALLNAIAASTTHTGTAFFYSNPLQLRTGHDGSGEDAPSERLPWYDCACCPPNLARLYASLHGYTATSDAAGLQLHLLAAGKFTAATLIAVVETGYPWDGDVLVTVSGQGELAIRVPAWAAGATVAVTSGQVIAEPTPGEYLRVSCDDGATVRLTLPMAPRLVRADDRVDAVRGCVAIERGPLVYCVEQADLPEGIVVEQLRLDPSVGIVEEPGEDGIAPVRLRLSALAIPLETSLYQPYDPASATGTPVTVTAIPYHAWANRGPGAMRVWLPLA